MADNAEKVIVTGNPAGCVIVHNGQHILPGQKYVMGRKEAELYAPDVVIIERHVEKSEVPKPEKREKPEEILKKPVQKVSVEQRVKAAETGRIERGGEKR